MWTADNGPSVKTPTYMKQIKRADSKLCLEMEWNSKSIVERMRMVDRRKMCLRLWGIAMWGAMLILFVYQASLNLDVYLSWPTMMTVSLKNNTNFRLPPFTVCPHPAYDPSKLRSLGLDISGHYVQFEKSYMNLTGVPDDLIASELWQDAGWAFGQVFMSVYTSMGGMVRFKASDPMPSTWQRSFSPLGPCYTYNAPLGETEVAIYFQTLSTVKVCPTLMKYQGSDKQCEMVKEECNSTCGMETYLSMRMAKVKKAFVYLHGTPEYNTRTTNLQDTLDYSKKLFDGTYHLQELDFLRSLTVTPHLTESSLLKGGCKNDRTYTHGQCYRKLHDAQAIKKYGCSVMYPSNYFTPSGQVCRSPNKFDLLNYMEFLSSFRCPMRCRSRRWTYTTRQYYYKGHLTMTATTTEYKHEEETETYPLSKLFSDTGGSLGLFLGVSLLSFLSFIFSFPTCCKRYNEKKKKHILMALLYCSKLILALFAGTHALETLRQFLSQPKMTAVSLKSTSPDNATESDLIIRRLAARALNCRSHETHNEECRARCLLELAANDITSVSPFTSLEGLPLCRDVGLSLPSPVYVVPSEMIMAATQKEKVNKCRKECGLVYHNVTKDKEFIMMIDDAHFNFDALQLACSLGGIIGLYLGYSMYDALDSDYCSMQSQDHIKEPESSKRTKLKGFHNTLKLAIAMMCVILIIWQFHTFLMSHKVSTSTDRTWRDNRTDQLAIIVCRWPPLSLQHVADQLSLNISTRLLYKLPKDQRLLEVLDVLDQLPGNWSSGLDELWKRAAWNITDVIVAFQADSKDGMSYTFFCESNPYCSKIWQPMETPLNRCFSLNATIFGVDITKLIMIFPEVLEKKGILGTSPQLYFTVAPVNELPLLDNMVAKENNYRILVTHHQAKYQQMSDSSKRETGRFSTCVYHCLSEAASSISNCRLPYMQWHPELPLCQQEQYPSIPRYYKGLEGIGRGWSDLKNSQASSRKVIKQHDGCYRACRHLQSSFHALTVDKVVDPYPTVVVKLIQEEDVVVAEQDLHTVSQFFSDVGGIAGSTAGFSLLYLMKDFLGGVLQG